MFWVAGIAVIAFVGILLGPRIFGSSEPEVFLLGEPTRDDTWDLYLWQEGGEPERIARGVQPIQIREQDRNEDSIVGVGSSEIAVAYYDNDETTLMVGNPDDWDSATELWRSDGYLGIQYRHESQLFAISDDDRCYVVDRAGEDTRLSGSNCFFSSEDPFLAAAYDSGSDNVDVDIVHYTDGGDFRETYDSWPRLSHDLIFSVSESSRGDRFVAQNWRSRVTQFESDDYEHVSIVDTTSDTAIVTTDNEDGMVTAWLFADQQFHEIGAGTWVAGTYISPELARVAVRANGETVVYDVDIDNQKPSAIAPAEDVPVDFMSIRSESNDSPLLRSTWDADRSETEYTVHSGAGGWVVQVDGEEVFVHPANPTMLITQTLYSNEMLLSSIDTETQEANLLVSGLSASISASDASGRHLLIVQDRRNELHLFDPQSGAVEELYSAETLWGPRFSSDGSMVYVNEGLSSNGVDLVSIDLETGSDDTLFRDFAILGATDSTPHGMLITRGRRVMAQFDSTASECLVRESAFITPGDSTHFLDSVSGTLRVCLEVSSSGGMWIGAEANDAADLTITIYDNGGALAYNDDASGLDPDVFVNVERGTYIIEIGSVGQAQWDADFVLTAGS